jgi:hypothetical protein
VIDLTNVEVIIGLFLGGMLTFAFAALTMKSVGRAAQDMIVEVRRQFAEIPGLREGKEGVKPEYAKCVDISTKAALREMILPGSLAVVAPLAVGYVLHGGARRVARRRARLRLPARHLHGERRRRLGQREEVHRGRQPRRQGLGGPQGGRHRRHRR